MKATDFLGGQYLRADQVESEPLHTTIERVVAETVSAPGKAPRQKIVLKLRGVPKPIVVNSTNAKVLIDMYGAETDEWLEKEIVLVRRTTLFAGKPVPALRLEKP